MTPAPDNLAALVDDMLLDVGFEQDADLRGALHSLGALASLPTPEPTGELAALLTAGGPARGEAPVPAGALDAAGRQPGEREADQDDGPPADELARRRRRRHRPTTLGLVLVAGMGLGVGGVAASSAPPGNSPVEQLLADLSPWNSSVSEPSAAGYGYRAPRVASDGELAAAGPEAAAGGATDAANLASRLLPDQAGTSRHTGHAHTGTPLCAGPVNHEAAGRMCLPAGAGPATQGNGAGRGTENQGTAAEEPAGPAAANQGKAGTPAPDNAPAAAGAAGGPAKPTAGVVQGQAGSQGTGQGNGPRPTSPAK